MRDLTMAVKWAIIRNVSEGSQIPTCRALIRKLLGKTRNRRRDWHYCPQKRRPKLKIEAATKSASAPAQAKTPTVANGKVSAAPAPLEDDELPDDYKPPEHAQVHGDEFHPWVDKKKMVGKTFVGILKGRFMKKGKKTKGGYGFTIQLEKVPRGGVPCSSSEPDPHNKDKRIKTDVMCRGGDLVSLDHTKALDDLQPLVESGGVYRVYLRILELIPLDTGNDFYKFDVRSECLKQPPPTPAVDGVPSY